MISFIWVAAISFLICINAVMENRFYPRYHFAPPKGWMNDPNGFSIYRSEYHLFYQHNPYSSYKPGIAHWGHAKSKDLFHWEDLGIALYPDMWYDKTGVFSGSAIVENNNMYLFFTGNVNTPGEQPDHKQCQALATSSDGVHFVKFNRNPIINASKAFPNRRDPKVWQHDDTYYMVLGNSFNNNTLGRVLLYASKDKINWKEVTVLAESNGELGYMWECPNFFELDGLFVLLFSPQGIKPQGDKYRNLYQTGYIIGKFNYNTYEFIKLTSFKELDHGHDFYATQTIENSKKERIMVAWFDMWKTNYPEKELGFTGQIIIPRILSLSPSGSIIQKPVREVSNAQGKLIHTGKTRGNTVIPLHDNAARIKVVAPGTKDFSLHIESQNQTSVSIIFDVRQGTVTLNRGGNDGIRRTKWKPSGSHLKWNIFIDASSIELFCGKGEVTFSSRFFSYGAVNIRLGQNCQADLLRIFNMKRTLYTR